MSNTIGKALSTAQAVHDKAEKDFPSPQPAAPAHEYSNASYGLVAAAKKKLSEPVESYKKTVKDIESPGIAQGVESRRANLSQAIK